MRVKDRAQSNRQNTRATQTSRIHVPECVGGCSRAAAVRVQLAHRLHCCCCRAHLHSLGCCCCCLALENAVQSPNCSLRKKHIQSTNTKTVLSQNPKACQRRGNKTKLSNLENDRECRQKDLLSMDSRVACDSTRGMRSA